MTSGRLCNYYRDDVFMMLMIMLQIIINIINGKLFEHKTKIVGVTQERPGNEGDANRPPVPILNIEVPIPLKYLSNLCRSIDLSLINC